MPGEGDLSLSAKDDAQSLSARLNGETLRTDWDVILSERVDAFVRGWETDDEPPELLDFLPNGPDDVRAMAVGLLIMADQEQRCLRQCMHTLEWYAERYGHLLPDGQLPCDVILEDLHLRRNLGETIDTSAYLRRFPQHAAQLRELMQLAGGPAPSMSSIAPQRCSEFTVGQEIDDFDLVNTLGKGSFATVFLARQRSMQRLVALKISRSRSNEPQTLAQLDHPHIVRVYDQRMLPEEEVHLLYMQFVPGGTLQDVIQQMRSLPPESRSGRIVLELVDRALEERGLARPSYSLSRQVLEESTWPEAVCWIGARLAEALEYAHHRGVLHRDIKPANVLLSEEGSPKLADFNISFSNEVAASAREFFGGSLSYMSPEQLAAYHPEMDVQPEDLDARSDIYSLGVLLWELATGDRPFHDPMRPEGILATVADMAQRRREGVAPETVQALPADFPRGLRDVLLRCLAPNPADRFADAGQLARALQLCLEPQVQALLRPDENAWRARAARHPFIALIIVALLPNVILSLLNIAFNLRAIIASITAGLPEDIAEYVRQVFLGVQLAVVNAVAYSLGIGICVALARPLAVAAKTNGRNLDSQSWLAVSRSGLLLPGRVGAVVLILWIASGLVFPMWIDLVSGHGQISLGIYLQFVTSQVLCGLIASVMSFFLVSYVCVQSLYPRIIPDQISSGDARPDLEQLSQQVNRKFFVLVLVPFAAVMAASWFLWKRLTTPGQAETIIRDALLEALVFGVLAILGAVAILAALWLGREIQIALEALRLAVCPPEKLNEPQPASSSSLLNSSILVGPGSSLAGSRRSRSGLR